MKFVDDDDDDELDKAYTQKPKNNTHKPALPITLTLTDKLKATAKPSYTSVATTYSQETEWVHSGTKNIRTCLLTYFPRTHMGHTGGA